MDQQGYLVYLPYPVWPDYPPLFPPLKMPQGGNMENGQYENLTQPKCHYTNKLFKMVFKWNFIIQECDQVINTDFFKCHKVMKFDIW